MGREGNISSFYHIGTHDLKPSIFYRGYIFHPNILGVEKKPAFFSMVFCLGSKGNGFSSRTSVAGIHGERILDAGAVGSRLVRESVFELFMGL